MGWFRGWGRRVSCSSVALASSGDALATVGEEVRSLSGFDPIPGSRRSGCAAYPYCTAHRYRCVPTSDTVHHVAMTQERPVSPDDAQQLAAARARRDEAEAEFRRLTVEVAGRASLRRTAEAAGIALSTLTLWVGKARKGDA